MTYQDVEQIINKCQALPKILKEFVTQQGGVIKIFGIVCESGSLIKTSEEDLETSFLKQYINQPQYIAVYSSLCCIDRHLAIQFLHSLIDSNTNLESMIDKIHCSKMIKRR